ncbi:MAG: hypothetical protein R3F02_19605 [Thiolinea sp.]
MGTPQWCVLNGSTTDVCTVSGNTVTCWQRVPVPDRQSGPVTTITKQHQEVTERHHRQPKPARP